MMETAHIVAISAGILFIDLQKFYDSVDLVLLMKARRVHEYPRIPLLLLVQAFLGPLTLRADGHHSALIPVSNGLVASSSQANHLARALLHRALHDHHHRCLTLVVSQFVDDLKMYTEGTTRQVVYRSSQPSVELFHSLGKLKVDPGWQETGFGISSTRHARDLGVDVSFGGRSVPSARKRAKRALIKARRIRSPHPRARMVTDLGHSTHIHETSACCGSVDLQRISRGNVYHHLAFHHKSWAISFTRGSHHRVSCVFARPPLQTRRIERAWQLLLRRFERAPIKRRWFQVTGFLSNVTAIIHALFVESSFITSAWRKAGCYSTRSYGVAQTSPQSPQERFS